METIVMLFVGSVLMFLYEKMMSNERELATLKEKVREMEDAGMVATKDRNLGNR